MKNAIAWFDIPTLDFQRAVDFYSTILGEPINVSDFMGQTLGFFPTAESSDVGGDLVPPDERNAPSKTGTRVYLDVNGKLDEVIGKVESAGGKMVAPKFSIGEMGWIATIEDTEGNVIGLWSA